MSEPFHLAVAPDGAGRHAAPAREPGRIVSEQLITAADEVLGLAQQLIRIDTTNPGDSGSDIVERAAAEWIAEKLTDVGLDPIYVESGAPGRGGT